MKLLSFSFSLLLAMLSFNSSAEVIKMGINHVSVPFAYVEADGQITGFEVELMREIGKVEGFELEVVPIVFFAAFDRLNNGDYDFLGHVYGTQERADNFYLLESYEDPLLFLSLETSPHGKNILFDQARVSVISYSPQDDELNRIKNEKLPSLSISAVDTNFLAFRMLFQDRADSMLAPASEINSLTRNYPQFSYNFIEVPKEYQQSVSINYLFKKEDKALYDRLKSGLDKLQENGIYQKLLQKYNLG